MRLLNVEGLNVKSKFTSMIRFKFYSVLHNQISKGGIYVLLEGRQVFCRLLLRHVIPLSYFTPTSFRV